MIEEKIKCEHENWVLACYPEMREYELGLKTFDEQLVHRVQSMYEVYCPDCGNFVNILSGEIINDKGLVRLNG